MPSKSILIATLLHRAGPVRNIDIIFTVFWHCSLPMVPSLSDHLQNILKQLMAQQATRLTLQAGTLHPQSFSIPQLKDSEVRIQVLFSGITRNDVLLLDNKLANDFFGVAAVGRIVEVGKEVGARKAGEVVGVYHENVNRGEFKTGFSNFLQVDVSHVVFLPVTIPLQQASGLLGDGVVAFNSVDKLPKGSTIAVVGSSNLAYLTVQFAKKAFSHHVTLLTVDDQDVSSFGADAVEPLSLQTLPKHVEKYDAVVVTVPLEPALSKQLQNVAIRTGKMIISAHFGYDIAINFFELIACQREFVGAKRGDIAQYVKMLQAAAFHDIQGKLEVQSASDYLAAFALARANNFTSTVVLKY